MSTSSSGSFSCNNLLKIHNLVSQSPTRSLFHLFLIVVLYAFFGLRLLYIAWRSNSKASQKKEMEEVCMFCLILDVCYAFVMLFPALLVTHILVM